MCRILGRIGLSQNWPKSCKNFWAKNWPNSNWPNSNWPNSNWPKSGTGLSRINPDWPKSNWPESSILDPLMPLLFCVGQHSALEAIQRGCVRMNDFGNPNPCRQDPHVEVGSHAGGERSVGVARSNSTGLGSDIPTRDQGIKVLGCPLGHANFVTAQLETIAHETPSLVAGDSQRQSLVVVAALRSSSCQFLFARCPAGLGGSVSQNPRKKKNTEPTMPVCGSACARSCGFR